MRAFEFLSEGKLQKKDFYTKERLAMFISKMDQGHLFKKTDGTEVKLRKDPGLIAVLTQQLDSVNKQRLPSIPNDLFDIDGTPLKLSALEKTTEFGSTEKEKFKVKPSDLSSLSGTEKATKIDLNNPSVLKDILETKAFSAAELGNRIINDPTLQNETGKLGQAIISMAKEIMSNQVPTIPSGLSDQEKSALRDYAGEYLGVLQMIQGIAEFPNKEPFVEHLGTDNLSTLKLYFPKAVASPLADSIGAADGGIAAVESPSGTVMKISSKGDRIGAPPSLDNLETKAVSKKKYAQDVVSFIDEAKRYGAAEQPFRLLNLLFAMPEANRNMSNNFKKHLPLSDKDIEDIFNIDTQRPANPKALALYKLAGKVKGTKFGKCHYAVNKQVIALVNSGNLSNLKKAVLEILGSNFVQIYSTIKGNKLQSFVLWPNKVNGDVFLYSKAYADAPTKAKLSFYVSR